MSSPTCYICQSPAAFVVTKKSYDHYQCPACELLFVHPQPTEAELTILYSSATGYQKSKAARAHKPQPVHRTYKKIISFLTTVGAKNVLDVGCSSGDFLHLAQLAKLEAAGIEPNNTTAQAARDRGLAVTTGLLDETTELAQRYDAVHLGDVIEHVVDPRDLLAAVERVSVPEGYVIIVTPNSRCLWAKGTMFLWKLFRIPCSVLTPPHHLWLFSDQNLDQLLSEKQYTLVTRWYNHLPNLKYEFGNTHTWGALKRKKNLATLARFVTAVGSYGMLFGYNYLTKWLRTRDFGMISIYKKQP